MRIAFLDSWLQNAVDGSGTAASIGGLGQALRRQGHTVTRFGPFTQRPANLTLRRLLFNAQLPALLRALRYDLIVGFDIDGVLISGRSGNTPYVCCVKGVIAEELLHERGQTRALFQALARLERHNARHADMVLTDTAYARAAIGRHYGVPGRKVRLVPAGIDLARWQRIAEATPRQSDGATILCVARQYPRKHVADLLRAMPLVRQQVPQAHAVIVGDGPEHASLRALAGELGLGEAVRFLGALPDDDEVARWYRRADIFCLPSVQEGFGMVFVEAMASGLPVVATLSAAIPEVVPRGRAGLLVPPAQPQALAAALVDLLRSPAKRAAFGDFGQQHVAQYEWDRIARLFLASVAPLLQTSVGEVS
ncbi:glycosyltransferase family 4 protein [Chloroflexia bacterium SDU3-3]|nr:glycosyltransferase family 4 protein [Chloroflexia bacterium SDU3-3]